MKTLTVKRPWGQFEQFTQNEMTTVKVISVNPNSSLSLQFHNKRREFWRVLSGHPLITIGENTTAANPGDDLTIEKLQKHRIATKDDLVQILEIAYGDFDENDIVRIEDIYGRA
jgi:mannose-6-phosphate isomerase-like protein (cupin superfamily)